MEWKNSAIRTLFCPLLSFSLGETGTWALVHTPGHTSGSVCLGNSDVVRYL